jgi:hypothetical protein
MPVMPTPAPAVPPSVPSPDSSCAAGNDNLGSQLSDSDYQRVFPLLADIIDIMNPNGRESQISLLVGGTYSGPLAAEIEGRIVVLGDFLIGARGVNSLGTLPTPTSSRW